MKTILVTGANGEVGHGLIPALALDKDITIVACDIADLDSSLKQEVTSFEKLDVTDTANVQKLIAKYDFDLVFHLASILSTGGEKNPELTQKVNAEGTANLLATLNSKAVNNQKDVTFIFPSTIAAYGIPESEHKWKLKPLKENTFLTPITMYGVTKLYCENLGLYYADHYKLLEKDVVRRLDFRAIRFPGIISALTLPSGGTSDYAPEMIHSAAKGEHYEAFVRADTVIPFMVMPDAIKALVTLASTPKDKLTQRIYNVQAFSVVAQYIENLVTQVFPGIKVTYKPDLLRQRIVDSWPAEIDDSPARRDWGWQPNYDISKAFSDYLIPEIKNKYA